jgi:ubiquinone/menaquinone biosynthesis C-methylase UbiE
MTGLLEASKRAKKDGLEAVMLGADGASLPLVDASVDAVSHSDVLCCLTRKGEVIGECHRVLKPGGTLVFTVLELSEFFAAKGIEDHDFGPEFALVDQPYEEMLAAAGFQIEIHDWTGELRQTAEKTLAARKSRFDRLAVELGVENATDSVLRSERTLTAIDRGDLIRRFFVCHT